MKNSTYSRRSQIVSTVKSRRRRFRWPAGAGTLATWWSCALARGQARGGDASYGSRCRHPNAEVQQLSLDALVAPARVLGGQADDQLLHVFVQRWSPVSTTWVGPGAGDHSSMPSQQRLRGDDEAGPAGSGNSRLMAASMARSAGPAWVAGSGGEAPSAGGVGRGSPDPWRRRRERAARAAGRNGTGSDRRVWAAPDGLP